MRSSESSFSAILQRRADQSPHLTAFSFVDGRGEVAARFTWAELDRAARTVAGLVLEHAAPGDRVVLTQRPGPEYVAGFFGCLYAGAVAVTSYPPNLTRQAGRFAALLADAEPALVLAPTPVIRNATRATAEHPVLGRVPWHDLGELDLHGPGAEVEARSGAADDLAFLQYTSGTTARPRGVMVSNGNLVHNSATIHRALGYTEGDRMVSWLPPYHDMGLIGGILQPVFGGFDAVLMAPATFAQDPILWLEVVSRVRGTTSYAPNFAFQKCVEGRDDARVPALDLSAWRTVVCGAEPTHIATMDRFRSAFAPCGFDPAALRGAYGLAESTLAVTIGTEPVRALPADARQLERGALVRAEAGATRRDVVACGRSVDPAQELSIVDPESGRRRPDGQMGEVWLRSPSVAGGYWRRREETAEIFDGRIVGAADGEGSGWLRTGDLGILLDGELYVVGRRKDLIIAHGRNVYPHDVERVASTAHPALRTGLCAAVSIDAGDLQPADGVHGERVVLIAEVGRDHVDSVAAELAGAVCAAVAGECEVALSALILIRSGELARTSSGKIQRSEMARRLLAGELNPLDGWVAGSSGPTPPVRLGPDSGQALDPLLTTVVSLPQEAAAAAVLVDLLQRATRLTGLSIDPDRALAVQGLDSLHALALLEEIRQTWRVELAAADLLGVCLREIAREVTHSLAGGDVLDLERSGGPRTGEWERDEHAPFPLTPVQQAYAIGRSGPHRLGGVATHYYAEIDTSGLDLERLAEALEVVCARHPMLRCAVEIEGLQCVVPHLTRPALTRLVRPEDTAEQAWIERHRAELCAQVIPLGQVPMFDFRALELGEGRSRLLLSFDLLIGDIRSLVLILRDWRRVFEEPGVELPALGYSFREYVLAVEELKQGAEYARSLEYWRSRVAQLPPAPQLPERGGADAVHGGTFARREAFLDAEDWSRLSREAAGRGLTPSAVLLAAYAVVLAAWSRHARFTLAVTSGRRLALHPDVEQIVGDFTSIVLHECDLTAPDTFADRARRIQRRLMADLARAGAQPDQLIDGPESATGDAELMEAHVPRQGGRGEFVSELEDEQARAARGTPQALEQPVGAVVVLVHEDIAQEISGGCREWVDEEVAGPELDPGQDSVGREEVAGLLDGCRQVEGDGGDLWMPSEDP